MTIVHGKRHGNSYTNSTYKKITITRNDSECTNPRVMQARISMKLVLKICPESCDSFEKCLKKSLSNEKGREE